MDELDIHAVDCGDELRQRIQLRLEPCASCSRRPSSAPAPASRANWMPWDSSLTVSLSGQRVAAIRLRRSTSCFSGTRTRKGRTNSRRVDASRADSEPLNEARRPAVGAAWANTLAAAPNCAVTRPSVVAPSNARLGPLTSSDIDPLRRGLGRTMRRSPPNIGKLGRGCSAPMAPWYWRDQSIYRGDLRRPCRRPSHVARRRANASAHARSRQGTAARPLSRSFRALATRRPYRFAMQRN